MNSWLGSVDDDIDGSKASNHTILYTLLLHTQSRPEAYPQVDVKCQDIDCYTHYPSPKLNTG